MEFSEIIREAEKFNLEPFFSKYFKEYFKVHLEKAVKPSFPKFIHYSAHAETLDYFMLGLNIPLKTKWESGTAMFLEFLKDKNSG